MRSDRTKEPGRPPRRTFHPLTTILLAILTIGALFSLFLVAFWDRAGPADAAMSMSAGGCV